MRLQKSFQLALNILFHSKIRSWLTIIGIIIGIAAVVSIVSISQGAEQQLNARFGSLGADIITITPGAQRARGFGGEFGGGGGGEPSLTSEQKNLTNKDLIVMRSIPNVKYVMGSISGRGNMTYLSKTASSVSINGVDAAVWKDITTSQLSSGRFLTESDSFSVVLGGNLVNSVFNGTIPLNSEVNIAGKSFRVVGILTEGSTIYMPMDITRTVIESSDNYVGNSNYNSISVKMVDISLANETMQDITNKLMLSRGILQANKVDFTVSSPLTMQQTIQQTMQTMSIFLGAIAAISLLVGAIGISNTMFTSVLEKTRDIGIMKAIGAKNKDILLVFLFNSGLIGLVGGIGGVIFGVIGSGFISYLTSSTSSVAGAGIGGRMFGNTAITPQLLIFSLVFSMIIGMIAGAIPAYRASRLNPVDALRYE